MSEVKRVLKREFSVTPIFNLIKTKNEETGLKVVDTGKKEVAEIQLNGVQVGAIQYLGSQDIDVTEPCRISWRFYKRGKISKEFEDELWNLESVKIYREDTEKMKFNPNAEAIVFKFDTIHSEKEIETAANEIVKVIKKYI